MIKYNLILEILITIVLLIIIYLFAYRFRNRKYPPSHPYRKYFIPALTVKIIGAICISLIYIVYYGGGDTTNFFFEGQIINSAADESFKKWLNLILGIPDQYSVGYYQYIRQLIWYNDKSSFFVASLAGFISFFLADTFLPTAIIFAVISFTGIWALFRSFSKVYASYQKQIAVATLFIPSVIIWGSGIFKDTLCLCFLGWITYYVFELIIHKKYSLVNITLTLLLLYFIYIIKIYILLAFIPAIFIWILFMYTRKIQNASKRIAINIGCIGTTIIATFFLLNSLGSEYLGRYSLDQITETAEVTRGWITKQSGDEGSGYDLGKISNPTQMILKFPAAVNVTLFRPYLWESNKLIVLLSAIESFLFLILTLKTIFIIGFKKLWVTITSDPVIQFCLIFSLLFAFAVGISTYNFGSLSRYKIPCLPFYAIVIVLAFYKNTKGKHLFKLFGI